MLLLDFTCDFVTVYLYRPILEYLKSLSSLWLKIMLKLFHSKIIQGNNKVCVGKGQRRTLKENDMKSGVAMKGKSNFETNLIRYNMKHMQKHIRKKSMYIVTKKCSTTMNTNNNMPA